MRINRETKLGLAAIAMIVLVCTTIAAVPGIFSSVNSASGYQVAGSAGSSGQSLCSDGTFYDTPCSAASPFYQTIKSNGTNQPQEPALNFNGNFVVTDSSGVSTNIAIKGFVPQRSTTLVTSGMSPDTQATIVSETVTFPAGTGTYRALVQYGGYFEVGSNNCQAVAYDTTNNVGFALSGQNSNGSGFMALTGSELSSTTYAAGASALFKFDAICHNGAGGLVGASTTGFFTMSPANEPTYLSVTPIPSN